ncbi:MAG: DNA primase, partial [Clostridia bacterium]|nr:DNA primase [Clostridia bacterium]
KKLHNIVTNKPHARQQAELGLLRMVIENPEYLEAVRPELGKKFFMNNGCQHILDAFQCRISNGDCKPAVLANDLNDDDQHLLGAVMAGELPEGDRDVLLKDYIRTIKLSDKRQQKRDLLADLDAAERAGDLKRANELMIVINNLMKTP